MKEVPNGVRYRRVGGTRQRHFTETNSQPHELPENAQTPTRRVHAVLGVCVSRHKIIKGYEYHKSAKVILNNT